MICGITPGMNSIWRMEKVISPVNSPPQVTLTLHFWSVDTECTFLLLIGVFEKLVAVITPDWMTTNIILFTWGATLGSFKKLSAKVVIS